MGYRLLLLLSFLTLINTDGFAQTCEETNPCANAKLKWAREMIAMLHEFKQCQSPIDDKSPCNYFLGRAIKKVFGINDFTEAGAADRYLSADRIAKFVKNPENGWTELGPATDSSALNEAQGYANTGKAVIAVGSGHVALIIPGTQKASGKWSSRVPCAASFRLDSPGKSFVGCPLAYAWTSPQTVKIYGRNH